MDRICPFCNTRPVSKHRGVIGSTCGHPECRREYINQKHNCAAQVAVAEGLCIMCKKVPPTEGTNYCITCDKKNKDRIASYQKSLKDNGLKQISLKLDVDLLYAVDDHAYSQGKSRTRVFEEAIVEYLKKYLL